MIAGKYSLLKRKNHKGASKFDGSKDEKGKLSSYAFGSGCSLKSRLLAVLFVLGALFFVIHKSIDRTTKADDLGIPVSAKTSDGYTDLTVSSLDGLNDDGSAQIHVCLLSNNPRTASIFLSGYLKQRGNGVLRYISNKKGCKPTMPLVRLMFQKDIRKMEHFDPHETLLVQGDEFCRCPFKICEDGSLIQARQYYNKQYDSSDAEEIPMYLPLGPRLDFLRAKVKFVKRIPISKRKYLFNLVVSPTNPTRKDLEALARQKIEYLGGKERSYIHLTPAWSRKLNDTQAGFISTEQYKSVLSNSAFTLCPAGHNPEAFRIFEACEMGSIPVIAIDSQYSSHSCDDAFAPFLKTSAPFVILNDWNEFPEKIKSLKEKPEIIEKMQQELLLWHDQFWRNITKRFECKVLERYNKDNMPEDCLDPVLGISKWKSDGQITGLKRLKMPSTSSTTTTMTNKNKVYNGVPLVTGCGRSGTFSLADYLRSIGIPAVHEGVAQDHVSVSWLYAAQDKRYPFESPSSARLRVAKWNLQKPDRKSIFEPVVHLVRHPLKVISSTRRCFCGKGTRRTQRGRISDRKSWLFVERHIPSIAAIKSMPYDSMERSALYWLEWNNLIEANFAESRTVLRLEDINPHTLLIALGLAGKNTTVLPLTIPHSAAHVSPQGPKQKYPDVTWKDLHTLDEKLARTIWDKAQSYGYEVGNNFKDAIYTT